MTMAGGFDVHRQHIMFITPATTGWCNRVRFVRTPGNRCGAGWLSTAGGGNEFVRGPHMLAVCQRGADGNTQADWFNVDWVIGSAGRQRL
jgi:hypothetical protein